MNRRQRIILAISLIFIGIGLINIGDAFSSDCEQACCQQCEQ